MELWSFCGASRPSSVYLSEYVQMGFDPIYIIRVCQCSYECFDETNMFTCVLKFGFGQTNTII